MEEPLLILSDLHLGHGASKIGAVEELRPLLEGTKTLVLNGDTFEELSSELRPASEVLLGELRQLCAEMGMELVLLSGNHDPGWPGKGWLELAGGKIVVTHGDAVMWEGSPWSREAFARVARLRELWAEHRAANKEVGERLRLARKIALELRAKVVPKGRSLFRRVLDALNPPRRALEILRVWTFQAQLVVAFGEHYFPQAEVLVVGHFHRKGLWRKRGRVVINTGAYVNPHASLWLSYENGWLRVGEVEEKGGQFHRGPVREVLRLG